ncbi:hypothetical protein AMJ86_09490, partial [bacterium SM23_57]
SGDIVATGTLDSGGTMPDLTPLFVGSEGTLGYITSIMVRLIDAPESARTMLVFFPRAGDAAAAVSAILKERLLPSVLEFLDRMTLKAITGYVPLEVPEQAEAMLLIEVDGKEDIVGEELISVIGVCREYQGFHIEEASDTKERDQLWSLRRSVSPSLSRLASGKINEDVCVPRGELIKLVEWCQDVSKDTGLMIPVYGHAADGNLHVNVMYNSEDRLQGKLAYETVERILAKTLELGGTLSGEHGIGRSKRSYLSMQFDPHAITYFRGIKHVWDPEGLFNPDIMYPSENIMESP